MIQFALVAGGADFDLCARAEEVFPQQVGGFAAQFVEGNSVKLAEAHEHAAGRARPQVDAIDVGEEARKLDPAGHSARLVDAKRKQFGAGDVFEAGRADGEEGKASIWQTTHTLEILPNRSGIAIACPRFRLSGSD